MLGMSIAQLAHPILPLVGILTLSISLLPYRIKLESLKRLEGFKPLMPMPLKLNGRTIRRTRKSLMELGNYFLETCSNT